jgi:dCTP deaminase
MILTKEKILDKLKNGELTFKPQLDRFQLQAHSVDLRLGFTFLVPKIWKMTDKGRQSMHLSPLQDLSQECFDIIELEKGQFFELLPQEHIMVSTFEKVKVPHDLMAVLYPRSSTNRKGLSLDLTGIIDAGYEGQLVLPIRNNTRSQVITLYPGERFCQLVFDELTDKVRARKSKYHNLDVIEGVAGDKKIETDLILKGDIEKLKENFKI